MKASTFATAVLTAAWFVSVAAAHPFHGSVALLDYNTESGRWEVSLWVHAVDLERDLTKIRGQAAELEDIEEIDKHLAGWVADRFQLRLADGKAADQTFVGHEIERDGVWLHFEMKAPADLQGAKLVNRIFVDSVRGQSNLATFRGQRRQAAVRTDREHPVDMIRWQSIDGATESDQ